MISWRGDESICVKIKSKHMSVDDQQVVISNLLLLLVLDLIFVYK